MSAGPVTKMRHSCMPGRNPYSYVFGPCGPREPSGDCTSSRSGRGVDQSATASGLLGISALGAMGSAQAQPAYRRWIRDHPHRHQESMGSFPIGATPSQRATDALCVLARILEGATRTAARASHHACRFPVTRVTPPGCRRASARRSGSRQSKARQVEFENSEQRASNSSLETDYSVNRHPRDQPSQPPLIFAPPIRTYPINLQSVRRSRADTN